MHGNVYEYCVDGFTFLLGGRDAVDPVAPEDKNDCVIRGGSWNKDADFARSAGRFRGGQTLYCNDESGFRFVVAPELKTNAE
jgi:formylglycine-generating enzyme required for sulfatase activity